MKKINNQPTLVSTWKIIVQLKKYIWMHPEIIKRTARQFIF